MEFGEILAMVVVFIGAPWAIFTGIAKVKASNLSSTQDGGALRMSELRRLIDQAVNEATEPLIARIQTLEAIVTDDDGPPVRAERIDPALLADGVEETEEVETASPHAVRT